jgi:hypothetical protein
MKFTRIEWIVFTANSIKGATVAVVSSAALAEVNPWVIVIISVIGGTADKLVSLIKSKELKKS